MSFVDKEAISISLSTLGAGVGYSTKVFTGNVESVTVVSPKAVGANSRFRMIDVNTTTVIYFAVADPSTLGSVYKPTLQSHSSSGVALGSSAAPRSPSPCTSCGHRRRSRASPGSGPTRCPRSSTRPRCSAS